MTSEAYKMGFKDATDGREPAALNCPWKQEEYNRGYEDGSKARNVLAAYLPSAVYRGGC